MPNFLASWQPSERRDAGAAERTGLENRSGGNSTGGSNPPLSGKIQYVGDVLDFLLRGFEPAEKENATYGSILPAVG